MIRGTPILRITHPNVSNGFSDCYPCSYRRLLVYMLATCLFYIAFSEQIKELNKM